MDYIRGFDRVFASKYAGWDPTQAIDDNLDKIFEKLGCADVDRFVNFVAESRSQSYEDASKVAGGRVWIAKSAKEIGLVDETVGTNDAITYAVTKKYQS